MDENVTCFDIVPKFTCKCDKCRNTCCKLWSITLTEEEYFRLIGLECSPKLRKILDGAFSILNDATPLRYAVVNLNYYGNCPLLDKKGMCSLQNECGEAVIPQICRQYPRCKRLINTEEFALTNSCEKTLELILLENKPLKFISYKIDNSYVNEEFLSLTKVQKEIRNNTISIMQNIELPILERFILVAKYLSSIQPFEFNSTFFYPEFFDFLKKLVNELGNKHYYLEKYIDTAEKKYRQISYEEFIKEVNVFFSNEKMEMFFTNVLINHMFYNNFPFSSKVKELDYEYICLKSVFGFLLYLIIGNDIKKEDDLVDLLAFSFRLIEHSSFYYNVVVIKNMMGI